MRGIFPVLVAVLVAMTPAAHADVWSDLGVCRSLGDAERLACFDRVLARHDAAPAAKSPASEFGAERLPGAAEEARQTRESIQAKVTKVTFNAIKHFTIALDNGQIWRQLASDTALAELKGSETVNITRGFLNSYSLSIEGVWGTYRVKRIK
jgi:hypothetical protein